VVFIQYMLYDFVSLCIFGVVCFVINGRKPLFVPSVLSVLCS